MRVRRKLVERYNIITHSAYFKLMRMACFYFFESRFFSYSRFINNIIVRDIKSTARYSEGAALFVIAFIKIKDKIRKYCPVKKSNIECVVNVFQNSIIFKILNMEL